MSDRVADLAEKFVVNGLVPLGLVGLLIWFVFEDRGTDRTAMYGLIDQLIKQQGELIKQIDTRDERIMEAVVKGLGDMDNELKTMQKLMADMSGMQRAFAQNFMREAEKKPPARADIAPVKPRKRR